MPNSFKKLFSVRRGDTFTENEGCHLRDINLLQYVQPMGRKLCVANGVRYFIEPKQYPLDLTVPGVEHHVQYKYFNPDLRLENFQLTLMQQFGTRTRSLLAGLDIFTHGDVLEHIMMTPYRPESGWHLLATRLHGRIYLNLQHYEHYEPNSVCMRPSLYTTKLMQHCLADLPDGEPEPSLTLLEFPSIYGVFRASLRHINLLWASEVSGLLNKNALLELDYHRVLDTAQHFTMRAMRSEEHWRSNDRMLEWSVQSLLSNAEHLILGFYNRAANVPNELLHVELQDLMQNWKIHCCYNFLYKILDTIEDLVRFDDDPHITWEFKYSPEECLVLCRRHNKQSKYDFISPQFMDALSRLNN